MPNVGFAFVFHLDPPPDHSTIRFRLIYSLSCSLANDAICITHCPFFFLSLTLTTNSPFMIPFCFTFCWFFFIRGSLLVLNPPPSSTPVSILVSANKSIFPITRRLPCWLVWERNDLATSDHLFLRKLRKNTSFFCNVTQKNFNRSEFDPKMRKWSRIVEFENDLATSFPKTWKVWKTKTWFLVTEKKHCHRTCFRIPSKKGSWAGC